MKLSNDEQVEEQILKEVCVNLVSLNVIDNLVYTQPRRDRQKYREIDSLLDRLVDLNEKRYSDYPKGSEKGMVE